MYEIIWSHQIKVFDYLNSQIHGYIVTTIALLGIIIPFKRKYDFNGANMMPNTMQTKSDGAFRKTTVMMDYTGVTGVNFRAFIVPWHTLSTVYK